MNNNVECADYFKSKSEYHRCMEAFRKKWKSLGRASGCITLKDASENERRAIGGILGKTLQGENIRVDFAKFEQGLQATRFAPIDMKEVLEAYFGETLYTNQGEKQARDGQKKNFFDCAANALADTYGDETAAVVWIREMSATKKYGYRQLIKEYNKDSDRASDLVQNIGTALVEIERLEKGDAELPLAVFAAEISGNPHYFDRGTVSGQLLQHAICFWKNSEFPANAYQWRELLLAAKLIPDNVSSLVHAYGLHLQTESGLHPAYEAFCALREPYVITMENLKGITGADAENDRVYIVENEMVFCYLVEQFREKVGKEADVSDEPCGGELTMLCTSGQPRAVAQKLISLILRGGAEIYYSGDIDPDGIGIADRLWQRYGEQIHIWRMSPEDYMLGISGEEIGSNGMAKLENVSNPMLRQTAECVRAERKAAYQENLLENMLGDIMRAHHHS